MSTMTPSRLTLMIVPSTTSPRLSEWIGAVFLRKECSHVHHGLVFQLTPPRCPPCSSGLLPTCSSVVNSLHSSTGAQTLTPRA